MITVQQALEAILDGVETLGAESVGLDELAGRIAAEDHLAKITQPPFSASAMDGYAVRFADLKTQSELEVVGEVKAGASGDLDVEAGQAVRIFTGATVPSDADHVIMQEQVRRTGNKVTVIESQVRPRNIRQAGSDFVEGAVLATSGDILNEIHGALFAAANLTHGRCVRKPTVAFFSNGDELKEPGAELASGQVINSNRYALNALIRAWGGTPIYLGCAPDDPNAIEQMFVNGKDADLIVPIGGASVGDYDFVRTAFVAAGGKPVFDKVAVRPSKPTWYGILDTSRVIGLPGNPASAIVGATLFIKPLIRQLAGHQSSRNVSYSAVSQTALPENGSREAYLRACVSYAAGVPGLPSVAQYQSQDSSLLLAFAQCNALIRREANAPKVSSGESVDVVQLVDGGG